MARLIDAQMCREPKRREVTRMAENQLLLPAKSR